MRLRRTTRSRRREPLAVLATTVCVLAAVGCDAGSPLAPDFGVEEARAAPATGARSSAHGVRVSEREMSRSATSTNCRATSARPLVVIDGVVQPEGYTLSESDVGHLDIDFVEILKGRTAMSLYGPRGEYSVVEIWTKRGTRAAVLNGRKRR